MPEGWVFMLLLLSSRVLALNGTRHGAQAGSVPERTATQLYTSGIMYFFLSFVVFYVYEASI